MNGGKKQPAEMRVWYGKYNGCPGSSGPDTFETLEGTVQYIVRLHSPMMLKLCVITRSLCFKESVFTRRWWSNGQEAESLKKSSWGHVANDFSSNLIIAALLKPLEFCTTVMWRSSLWHCFSHGSFFPKVKIANHSKYKPKETWWITGLYSFT